MKYFLLALIFWSFNSYANFSDLYKEFEEILDKEMEKDDEIVSFGKKINSYIKKLLLSMLGKAVVLRATPLKVELID